ncbi:MAG: DUF748 domain-containing protein [Desulfofustis sp.]|nr:DUF748 domain-containing protein [Desulfofustis sp.]
MGLIVALGLLLLLLPIGTKYYLADWLRKNGADQASIETLRFNPFLGRITMEGMDVQRDGQSLLRNAHLVVDFNLLSLLQRDVHLESVHYRDLSIDIEQRADGGWRFGSYSMTGGAEAQPEAADQKPAGSWGVLADQMALTDCRVRLKTPQLDLVLVIDKAELLRFSTREGHQAASFTLSGLIDDSPIAVDLKRIELVPELNIFGTVAVSEFQLVEIAGFLGDALPIFAGAVELAGDVSFGLAAENGMQAEYNGTIAVGAAAIGNDGFSTAVRNLSWHGRAHYAGTDDGALTVLADGVLAADDSLLQLTDASLEAGLGLIELRGRTEVTIDQQGRVTVHQQEGAIQAEGFELSLPQAELTEERLAWQGEILFASDHQDQGLLVSTDGSLELGALQGAAGDDLSRVQGGSTALSWQGTAAYGRAETGGAQIELDGQLSLTGVLTEFDESGLRLAQEGAELRAESVISLGEEIGVAGHHGLVLEKFNLTRQDQPLVAFDHLRVADIEGRGAQKVALHDLQISDLQAIVPGSLPLQVAVERIDLASLASDDLADFQAGEVRLEHAVATATRTGEQLIGLAGAAVHSVTGTDRQAVTIDTITLEQLAFLPGPAEAAGQSVLTFGTAALDGLSWSETDGVQGESLQLTDLVATVVREPSGRLVLARRLAAMQESDGESATNRSTAAAGEEMEAGGIPFALTQVLVDGRSSVSFSDYTLSVPFAANLAVNRLEVGRLDTGTPDRATTVLLQGELEGRAPVELSGSLAPFLERPAIDLRLNLKNYPLNNLSPYTVQAVGTALSSGRLRLESELKLADDLLQMDNTVLLQQLQTETIAPVLAEELDNQLPIPLDAALSLLRDNDGNISLDVPLSGPVSDLDVGVSGVLITALSQAIVPAASGYLMYALGPYGALAYVGMKLGEQMLEVVLPPVAFAPQESSITTEHADYLERIGAILTQRPETDLQLCPVVASWEFLTAEEVAAIDGTTVEIVEEGREPLVELGQLRAGAVRDHLVESKGIEPGRLLICETRIEKEKQAQPAVLLQM